MRSGAIEEIRADLEGAVLCLNNDHATELSFLDAQRLRSLLRQAFYARAIGAVDAFLIALDQGASYDSPNYEWFRMRFERFVYVDRIVVRPAARGLGISNRLYADLAERATAAGHRVMVCEINSSPPNPISDAFHFGLGFVEVGAATIHGGAKTVRYLARYLPDVPESG